MTMQSALAEVRAGHAQRICVPGKWRVWREGDKVKHEILEVSHANN
jgi:hypothetical protein